MTDIRTLQNIVVLSTVSQPYGDWLDSAVSKAEANIEQGRVHQAIHDQMGLVVDSQARRAGFTANEDGDHIYNYLYAQSQKQELDPQTTRVLRAYLPLPDDLLDAAIDNLPEEIAALPKEEQARFILMTMAVIHKESVFNASFVQPSSATGLMQIKPTTAGVSSAELLDPAVNIREGMEELYDCFCQGAGDFNFDYKTTALLCYRWGDTGAKNAPNKKYPKQVMLRYRLYKKLYESEVIRALG